MLKIIILFISILHFSTCGFSQIYGKVMQFRPTGEFGFVMKKTISAELGSMDEFEDAFRFRYHVNFTYLQPRLATFNLPAYISEQTLTTFYPATQKFKTMINVAFGVGWDFSPDAIDHWKLRPYIGLDIVPGFHLRYTEYSSIILKEKEFNVSPFLGFKGRTGLQYSFKNLDVFIELERTYALILKYAFMNYNNIGIGISRPF